MESDRTFVWLSDIHLPFLDEVGTRKLFESVMEREPAGVFLSGDISDARHLEKHLSMLADGITAPIYFVLGNHDYYHGEFTSVDALVRCVCRRQSNLHLLKEEEIISLSAQTALVGHEGWGDGRAGAGSRSFVQLTDFMVIRDLVIVDDHADLFRKLAAKGDECAQHLRDVLPKALESHRRVVVILHVPPFEDAARYQGKPSEAGYAPHFCCVQAGQVILENAAKYPERQIRVFCGHTHEAYEMQAAPNVTVTVNGSDYRTPEIRSIEIAV